MKILPLVALTAALSMPGATFAAERTVTLNVANATCELCGPIVKGSLASVSGVLDVQISEADGAAIAKVRFEDSRTDVAALIAATTNAGYAKKPESILGRFQEAATG
jgi:mercuric ion binding protein